MNDGIRSYLNNVDQNNKIRSFDDVWLEAYIKNTWDFLRERQTIDV